MEEVEEEEGTEQFKVFGVHRLLLAPGTRSGYLLSRCAAHQVQEAAMAGMDPHQG